MNENQETCACCGFDTREPLLPLKNGDWVCDECYAYITSRFPEQETD